LINSNYNELYQNIKDIEKVPQENININKENMNNIKHFIEEDFKKMNDILDESNTNQEKEYKKVQENSENFKLTLGKEEQKIGELINSNKESNKQFISSKFNRNEENVGELINIVCIIDIYIYHHILILINKLKLIFRIYHYILKKINNNEKYSKDFCNILNSNIIVTNENLNKTYSQVKVVFWYFLIDNIILL